MRYSVDLIIGEAVFSETSVNITYNAWKVSKLCDHDAPAAAHDVTPFSSYCHRRIQQFQATCVVSVIPEISWISFGATEQH